MMFKASIAFHENYRHMFSFENYQTEVCKKTRKVVFVK